MAGIYLHIPFCRKACRYCDFHFTVSLSQKEDIVNAMGKELMTRIDYTGEEAIRSIYFGGGTPSVLDYAEIRYLMDIISRFKLSNDVEVSFETNPDDLTDGYLKMLKSSGINRLSIGVQSFFEEDLVLMRRSHNAVQASESIERAFDLGFTNISIDLIYGIPGMGLQRWERNLETALNFRVPHISAYHLTFETGTVFDHWKKLGRIIPADEEESVQQFLMLRNKLTGHGYEHYEISNFAKEGYISRHNVNYWKQVPYIGVGPSAHSYNGYSRRWNVASNKKYCQCLVNDEVYYEEEILTEDNMFNEYIMTSLRTIWGIDDELLSNRFGTVRHEKLKDDIRRYLKNGTVEIKDSHYVLTEKGMFIADKIISELFI